MKVETIDLELTTNCNMKCPYCYIGCGSLETKGDMSDETFEQVFDLIEKYGTPRPINIEGGKQKKATHITMYGGEPVLSFDRLVKFVERSRERNMKLTFSALSNGTTGTKEQVDWFRKNNIWVQRSIDGHPEAQEKYRPNSIEAYKEKNEIWKDYGSSRRMTIKPEFAKDLLKSQQFFESMGFKVGISPMPDYYDNWTDEHVMDFCRSLWDIGRYYLKCWHENRPFYNYYLSREMVGRFWKARAQQNGCGGGIGLYCVSWDGWMYLCHRFSKEPHDNESCYGHITEVLAGTHKGLSQRIKDQIEKHRSGKQSDWRKECRDCIAQYSCEKGCMQINIKTTGDINKVPKGYCEIRREACKVVAWLDSELRAIDSDWWAYGNHLAKDYKTRAVAGNLLTKGVQTMITRNLENRNRRRG